jgi:hypothetical protein
MTTSKGATVSDSKAMALSALAISLLALLVAVGAAVWSAGADERVYQRMLLEIWQELKPFYADIEVDFDGPPATLGELLRPIMSVEPQIDAANSRPADPTAPQPQPTN